MTRTLIIFDVDGTLVDGNKADHESFGRSAEEVLGIALTEEIWSRCTEITSHAIVHQALGKEPLEDLSRLKAQFTQSYLARLQLVHGEDPGTFRAFPGAVEVFNALRSDDRYAVAIATGCWRETALFKLDVAGFDIGGVPFASSSDRYARSEIIKLAADRAGLPLDQAVYVGDGPWDFRATQELGIPFIGVGRKLESLRQIGATHSLEKWDEKAFSNLVECVFTRR